MDTSSNKVDTVSADKENLDGEKVIRKRKFMNNNPILLKKRINAVSNKKIHKYGFNKSSKKDIWTEQPASQDMVSNDPQASLSIELSPQGQQNIHFNTDDEIVYEMVEMVEKKIHDATVPVTESLNQNEMIGNMPRIDLNRKSPVQNLLFNGKYFKMLSKSVSGTIAKCCRCGNELKGYVSSNSNFLNHMKVCKKDPTMYENYKSERAGVLRKKHDDIRNKRFATVGNKSFGVSIDRMNDAILRFIIEDYQPLNRIESPAFQNLLAVCLGYDNSNDLPFKFMSRHTVRRRIETLYDQHENLLKSIISLQKWICLTADIWSCKNRSFMGVSIHFMDNNLQRQSYVIACKYFPAPHNYETITEFLQLLYSKFGIDPKTVVATVTDNGSNFVKAFQIFGRNNQEFEKFLQEIDELDDNIENFEIEERDSIFSILNTLYAEPANDTDDETEFLLELLYSSDMENSDRTRNVSDEFARSRITNIQIDDDASLALSNRISCNAHNFNLIGASDSLHALRNKQYAKIYTAVFEKLNMLWHCSGLQESSEIIMKHLGTNFHKPSKIRWNDVYEKILKILKHDEIALDIVMSKLNITLFSKSQRRFLEEYTDIMKIIADAINNLQGNKCPFAVLLPTLQSTKAKLNEMSTSNTLTSCKPLLSAVISGFIKRFKDIMNFDDKKSTAALIATVSHPFFKLRWLDPNSCDIDKIDKIKNILAKAADEISAEISSAQSANHSEDSNNNDQINQSEKGVQKAFSYKFYTNENHSRNVVDIDEHTKNYSQISKFLEYQHADDISDLSQLDEFRVVKNMYKKYNMIMTSEADIERLFSFGGMILRPHRRNMASSIFEKIIILQSNEYDKLNQEDIDIMFRWCAE